MWTGGAATERHGYGTDGMGNLSWWLHSRLINTVFVDGFFTTEYGFDVYLAGHAFQASYSAEYGSPVWARYVLPGGTDLLLRIRKQLEVCDAWYEA
jgi:hypothetical protein